jgi:hypothetical protein
VIIVLLFLGLIYELTVIPWFLHNDRFDTPWSTSSLFYLFWVFFDYSLYSLQIALFAWATIERHILIFHDKWISTEKKRLFVHYCPIVVITLYYFVYYTIVYFAKPCPTPFDGFLAGGIYIPCAFDRTVLATWDLMFHQFVPTVIILCFCIGLVVRVVYQKIRVRQPMQWRKHRKMIIQLLSISLVYIVFNLPWVLVIFAYQCGLSVEIAIVGIITAKFLYYNVIFCFPIVACLSLSELRRKFMQTFFCFKLDRQIGPMTTSTIRERGNTTDAQTT